jgi:spore germination protein GerM
MRKLRVLPAALALVTLLAACGDGSGTSSDTAASNDNRSTATTAAAAADAAERTPVTVYFLDNGRLDGVTREVAGPLAPGALDALIAGPTKADKADGLASDVPSITKVNSIDVNGDTAVVDVSPEFVSFSDATTMRTRTAQVVFTVLGQLNTVSKVQILLDGAPSETMPPVGTADFADLAPAVS